MKGMGLNELTAAGLAMVVIVIVISIGGQIISETQTAIKTTETDTTTNETLTIAALTATVVGDGKNPTDYAAVSLWNGTANEVDSSNYTLSTAGVFTLSEVELENETLKLTYTFTKDTESVVYNATEGGKIAMLEFADWFTIIVIVLIAVIVIALLVRGLGGSVETA